MLYMLNQTEVVVLVENAGNSEEEVIVVEDQCEEDDLMEMDGSSDQNMAKRKLPAQATVFSKRIPRTGVSMLETAEAKAVMKNLEAPGMHITNPFAILQKVNNSSLSS